MQFEIINQINKIIIIKEKFYNNFENNCINCLNNFTVF